MFQTISMRQVEDFLNGGRAFTLLDVRSREEFSVCRLMGAINIPYEELENSMGTLSRAYPIIVYCGHGGQSLMAARILARAGFTVLNACGGLAYYRGTHLIRETI